MRDKTGQQVKASRYQKRDVQLFPVITWRGMTVDGNQMPRFKMEAEIV
jgi:hypothetical protein